MGEENTTGKSLSKVSIWSDFRGFAIIAVFVILIWFASYFVMIKLFEHPEHAGPAGDLFGAATSLFSGLAFAGLISTLLMQRRELELQREQLRIQNEELTDTREEFEIQRFENRFFGMIKLVNDHVESMTIYAPRATISGRNALKQWVDDIDGNVKKATPHAAVKIEKHVDIFEDQYNEHEVELGTYFRLLYNIFRQLESQQCITDNDKKTYAAIIRAQLSSGEILLLMLNGISELGTSFQNLIRRYALLEHLPIGYKTDYQSVIEFYGHEAFGDRANLFFNDIEAPDA
ncbi:MAG: putative phage abortive infection protein [Hyphomicrobiales bacterium]